MQITESPLEQFSRVSGVTYEGVLYPSTTCLEL